MATKADFLNIWHITETNNGLVSWIPSDIAHTVNFVTRTVSEALAPADTCLENIIRTVRHPIETFFKKNGDRAYAKLIKFMPATLAFAIVKALDMPFATIEEAIEYAINNNVSRWVDFAKRISTKFLADLITSNGETNSKTAKFLWTGIEWIGDVVWSLVKTPFWLIQKPVNLIRSNSLVGWTKHMANWGEKFVEEQRINPKNNYYNLGLVNKEEKKAA